MKFLPRTLYGQLLLSLCLGLLAAQAAGIWLTLNDRARFGEGLLGAFAAQRIAGVITILDEAEPAERVRLVRALNVPPTHVSLGETWEQASDDGDVARSFIEHVQQQLGKPVTLQVTSIKRAEPHRRDDAAPPAPPDASAPAPAVGHSAAASNASAAASAASPATSNAERHANRRARLQQAVVFVTGQARLSDGTIVTFRHSLPEPGIEGPIRLLGLLVFLGISVALLSAWAVRRLTQPLASLAEAATGLAQNLDRPPLPETGPREVEQAARAFNAMQRDFKRTLDTRAQALAAVSHDLRMPITRLRLRLERLDEGELRDKMDADLTEMDSMIGNTLEYLRAGSIVEKACKIDLEALIESVTEDITALGATVRQHVQASAPVTARPLALRRCLTNLMDNARRYGGGNIDVSTMEQGKNLIIAIEDRGPGIPEAELERVFEPYVRVEVSRARHTGGTGLGLAIARAIARSHGGEVTLENRPGGGIKATLSLPLQA
jgi:signal transduction histidine kinase